MTQYSYAQNYSFGALPRIRRAKRGFDFSQPWVLALLGVLHIPFGLLIGSSENLAAIHSVMVLGLGMVLAVQRSRPIHHVALVAAYIVGSEVLWRMTGGALFWEFAKYATVAMFVTALMVRGKYRPPLWPTLYFALLLPSSIFTISELDLSEARRALSFNLSGPLALFAACWFFSKVTVTREHLQRILLVAIVPLVSVAVIATSKIVGSDDIAFTRGSNPLLSGGFGPNQVSAALGLGFFAALVCLLTGLKGRAAKLVILGIALWLAGQSAVTFSRGGLYNAVGALLVLIFFLARERRSRKLVVGVLVAVPLVGYFLLLPFLDNFSGGRISDRFASTNLTRRGEIAGFDVELGMNNPLAGVGPGMALYERVRTFQAPQPAHTEFTRSFGEHGALGLLALACLLVSCLTNLFKARDNINRAVAGSSMVWSLFYMTNAAMRLVAPAFMFGLGQITVIEPSQDPHLAALPKRERDIRVLPYEIPRVRYR
jgi:hypothetical protein